MAGFLIGANPADHATALQALRHVPLSFQQSAVKSGEWVAVGPRYSATLDGSQVTVRLASRRGASTLRMSFLGSNLNPVSAPREPLPGKVNYFIGSDPSRWVRDVPTYGRIQYQNVYDRTDVVWYGNGEQLEFDFVLHAGADPNRLSVRFDGALKLALEPQGDVRIDLKGGSLALRAPKVYQEIDGSRKQISGRYVLRDSNELAFQLAGYDKSRALVIDPSLVYASYYGTDLTPASIAVDSAGNLYMGGSTSAQFQEVVNSIQPAPLGTRSGFLTKFDPTGGTVLYSTYIGGSGDDSVQSIAVDASGEVVATGSVSSTDFPVTNAAVQPAAGGNGDAYALKINASGNAFVYSTYLGGSGPDNGTGIAVDSSGDAFVTGSTYSEAFPTTAGAYYSGDSSSGAAFVVKLSPAGSELFSTLLGPRTYGQAITVDQQGDAYVCGYASAASFPNNPPGRYRANKGSYNAFVVKLSTNMSSDATVLNWATFLGGTGSDSAQAIVRDSNSGILYIGGQASSADLPVTAGVLQSTLKGSYNAFVASLSADGSSFGFVTYLGGSNYDYISGITLTQKSDELVVAGNTASTDFPITSALQPSFPVDGASAGFITKLNKSGTGSTVPGITWSTYYGDSSPSFGLNALAAIPQSDDLWVAGTGSRNLPISPNAADPAGAGFPVCLSSANFGRHSRVYLCTQPDVAVCLQHRSGLFRRDGAQWLQLDRNV